MVPNINTRGHSFKGVTAYLLHDKNAETSERLAWTQTYNLHTDDVEKASRFMAWTDMSRDHIKRQHEEYTAMIEEREPKHSNAGRPAEAGNAYHFSLAWSPNETLNKEQMIEAAQASVERLGMSEHQHYFVAHDDTDHAHVHVVVNLAHPVTGLIADVYKDREKLDRWSNEYECENGIVCEDRAKKYEALDQGDRAFEEKKNGKQQYGQLATELYRSSDTAGAFQAALEDNDLSLAQGKRRSFVLVDRDGEVFNLNKIIEPENGQSARAYGKHVTSFLSEGIDKDALPFADDLAEQRKHYDRDAQEAAQQDALAEGADRAAQEKIAREDARLAAVEREEKRQKREHYTAYEKKLAGRVEESRQYWQIDKLEREQKDAQQNLKDHSGWLYRYVLRGKHREAEHQSWAADKNLEHARDRWRQDIEAIHGKRPKWAIDKELKERGFGESAVHSGDGQEREKIEAEQTKAKEENQVLKEAEQSDEAAARLDGAVVAKRGSDTAKVARIHARAREFRSKEVIKKQDQQEEARRKDKTRDKEREARKISHTKALAEQQRKEEERQKAEKQRQGVLEQFQQEAPSPAPQSDESVSMADALRQHRENDPWGRSEIEEDMEPPEHFTEEECEVWEELQEQRRDIERDDDDGLEYD